MAERASVSNRSSASIAPRRVKIFFYGLFMDIVLLREKGIEPVNVRAASAPDFSIRIGDRATLVSDPDSQAYGMLMELTHDEIEQLYSEPSVHVYRPEAISVKLSDGSHAAALCYNLPVPQTSEETNPEYAAKLCELARRLGFPSNYIDSIR